MKNIEYHVAKNGTDSGKGTQKHPFLTINKAASVATAGDTVIVHEGEYREWVKPKNKGLGNNRRITYQAAVDEKVVIKGSEKITGWENIGGTVWMVELPNEFFGEFNPYVEEVIGDWILYETSERKHLGEVYLNGMSFYETSSVNALENPAVRDTIVDDWTQKETATVNPEQTKYVWYAEVDEETTVIYANFHESNPNEELVEINVRKSCFYPENIGRDYITVKGFEMAQAATPWTPPTADQPGLIGANWSKGWIIEDNIIHDAKNSAVSLGKESSTGDNYYTNRKDKPGYQYQIETVFEAIQSGWSKENIGSHVVRNNVIYDCGQNGVVGHLGCVFSEIYGNHIYNIGIKREFYGHEIGGIKLHAAIDVSIHDNRIHDSSLGLWLDWQSQGTRVSRNIFYENSRDLFVEVSHGPYVIDHNIFASPVEMDNFSQGGAYINNLFRGEIRQEAVLDRATPYHYPHSTEVAGFATVYGGDDRYYGNLFIGKDEPDFESSGTSFFNGHTTSMNEFIDIAQEGAPGDHGLFAAVNQPVYINYNIYLNGAKAFEKESKKIELAHFDPKFEIIEEGDLVYLSLNLPEEFDAFDAPIQSSSTLIPPRIVHYEYENPDDSQLVLDTDFFGNKRELLSKVGPVMAFRSGENKVRVW